MISFSKPKHGGGKRQLNRCFVVVVVDMTGDIGPDLYFRNSFVWNPHNNLVKQVPCPYSRFTFEKAEKQIV